MNGDWILVAETRERRRPPDSGPWFTDFAPYVPSISDAGEVAFTAACGPKGASVFLCSGGPPVLADNGDGESHACSHPSVNSFGEVCVYTEDALRTCMRGEDWKRIAMPGIGPLGPTMNEIGDIAFRRDDGIYVHREGTVRCVAEVGTVFVEFQGLPVINDSGWVVFRADLLGGRKAIYLWQEGDLVEVVAGSSLGSFPFLNDVGSIAHVDTESGVFVWTAGQVRRVETGVFESYRGALLDELGGVVFYATPPGAALGIYRDGVCLLEIGSPLLGSIVTEFALNPVSINRGGDLAARVRLEDGRQAIVKLLHG